MANHKTRSTGGNDERFAGLFEAMRISDVPIARPNFSRRDEATGLTLLSLALKLSHVVRVTESLRLINTDHLSRSVNVDVDLRSITRHQREALTVAESPRICCTGCPATRRRRVGGCGFRSLGTAARTSRRSWSKTLGEMWCRG